MCKRLIVTLAFVALPLWTWAEEIPREVAARVDRVLADAWNKEGITPADRVDDARFLRRAWLDLCGRQPTGEEVEKFLGDESPGKRERFIEDLIASPHFAEHWAGYWDRALMGRLVESIVVDRPAFHRWLTTQFEKNTPWDKVVRELITASGINTSGAGYGEKPPADDESTPATSWFLRYGQNLPELSAVTSRVFLGVQIQCAQCHNSKDDKWTQDDFRRFTAFYAKTWPTLDQEQYKNGLKIGLIKLDLQDRIISPPMLGQLEQFFGSYREYAEVKPRTLTGEEMRGWGSRRKVLADWTTSPKNPWFAKALVNRIWGELLGEGFVEPIDDFRDSNPAIVSEALNLLADDFVASGCDFQRLVRVITQTKAYHLACAPSDTKQPRNGLWSRYPLKPLEIEVVFDNLTSVTKTDKALDKLSSGKLHLIREAFIQQFVLQMGTDEKSEVSGDDESISRALLQMNGALFAGSVQVANGLLLEDVLKSTSDDTERIRRLYQTVLTREPSDAELSHWQEFVSTPRDFVSAPGPAAKGKYRVSGFGAIMPSKEIASAAKGTPFVELVEHARTVTDFGVLAGRMTNLVDAGLYVKALREFAAEAPFQAIAEQGGGRDENSQAYEDMLWAMLNSSEFLTNH